MAFRRRLGMRKDEVTGRDTENCITRSFLIVSLLSIIRMIKPRKMRWVRHVAHIEAKRNM
jgi:hypothetical protein